MKLPICQDFCQDFCQENQHKCNNFSLYLLLTTFIADKYTINMQILPPKRMGNHLQLNNYL